MKKIRSLTKKNEFYVFISILLLCIIITIINPVFLTLSSMFDIIRSGIELGIFAVGAYIVIVSGGIDVSCAAVGTFAMFTTTKILYEIGYTGNVLLAYAMAIGFGLIIGLINGSLIAYLKIQPLIATLATSSMITGFMLFFIGAREISNVPEGIYKAGKSVIAIAQNEYGFQSPLPTTFFVLIIVLVITFVLMRYTMLGRGIYAIGGDIGSATRAGFNVKGIQMFLYSFVGVISALAGMVHTIMMINSNPVDLIGKEMIVIASVVIGGARITGGHGSLTGTMLGVTLVTIMNNSLILIGIPSYWQRFVMGMIILIGTGITSYQAKRVRRQLNVEISN